MEKVAVNLRSFYSFARPKGYEGLTLAKNLSKVIRLWLAEQHVRNFYQVDSLPPHQVIDLMSDIEHQIRSTWARKGSKTRAASRRRQAKEAEEARNPEPQNDTRQKGLALKHQSP